MAKHFITRVGLTELQQEYKEVIEVKIPEVLEGLNQAMSEGDLSENSARDALLLDQQRLNARKQDIEETLNDYELIEEHTGLSKLVRIGSTVKIEYTDTNKVFELKIMGSSEADILDPQTKISNESPLAEAILGKAAGTDQIFRHKGKTIKVKIIEIIA